MSDSQVTTTNNKNTPQGFIKDLNVQKMITDRLGKRAGQFTTSLLSLVNANAKIAECTPVTIVQAALTAASMDLPINQNLGFAYIVPYKNNKNVDGQWISTMEAQFQMGWKGFVQLAQRSGKFKTINTSDVREGEVTTRDRMTGELTFNWIDDDAERNKKDVIGYLAYFELLNGFSKSLYMTKAEIEAHAGRYSQAYKSSSSNSKFKTPWQSDFDLMAQKTALKLLLSKFAPLSTEMQEAIAADQSVDDGTGRSYIDNPTGDPEVRADDKKKADILAANSEPVEGEIVHEVTPTTPAEETPPAAPAKPETPKESVAEKAKRKYGKKTDDKENLKQAGLLPNDNNSQS